MYLKSLFLQNFRSYSKYSFDFDKGTTLVIGPNTAGKSNLVEAIYLLSSGKSFRADKDIEMISFDCDVSRIAGILSDKLKLEFTIVIDGRKKYLVNGVARRRVDFAGHLTAVLFSPLDLELLSGSPSRRRRFLDDILEQIDRDYRVSITSFEKALRQRNALLEKAWETGKRDEAHFAYWDALLIEHGQRITQKREELILYLNSSEKNIFPFEISYDKSVISADRLLQYKDAELGAGFTLVGPHRDDFATAIDTKEGKKDVKLFGSRGQQRLTVLQLKLLVLQCIEEKKGERPILILDDIFSELDQGHIDHVLSLLGKQQTILTTTHREFLPKKMLTKVATIELSEGR